VAYTLSLLPGVFLLALAPEFYAMWMGPSFAMSSGTVTRVLILSFFVFLPVRGVASPLLMGLGKPAWTSLAFVAMGIVNLGLSLVLVKPLGIVGVAVGTAIPCVLFAGGVGWLACRECGVPLGRYLRYVALRPSLGIIPPLCLLYFIKRGLHVFNIFAPRAVELPALFIAGLEMVVLFLVVWILYVHRGDPYLDLAPRIDRFVPPSMRGTPRGRTTVSLAVLAFAFGAGLSAIVLRDADPLVRTFVLLAAAAAVPLVILVEILAREVIRRWGGYYRYVPYYREERGIDPAFMPGGPERSHVEINRDGERGDPPPRSGEPAFRVLVVGGSAAECFLLDQTEIWSAVVQRILNEPEHLAALGVPRVHVGNIARAIVPVEQLTFLLRKVLPRYSKLDAALIMAGGADVVSWVERKMPPSIASGDIVLDKLFEQHPEVPFGWRPRQTALWRLLATLNRRLRRPVVVARDAGDWLGRVRRMRAEAPGRLDETADPSPMLAHFEENLRGLIEAARGRAARVILVRQPWFGKDPTPEEEATFWNYGLGRPYKEQVTTYLTPRAVDALMRAMDDRAAAVAEAMGVEHVDVRPSLEGHRRSSFYDELHFTPSGTELVGRAVAAALLGRRASPARGSRDS
jgi:hypothetical protein